MIEIILSVCLIDTPERCKVVSLPFLADYVTPMQCMQAGQLEAIKWLEGHPKWQIQRWSCRPAGKIADL